MASYQALSKFNASYILIIKTTGKCYGGDTANKVTSHCQYGSIALPFLELYVIDYEKIWRPDAV